VRLIEHVHHGGIAGSIGDVAVHHLLEDLVVNHLLVVLAATRRLVQLLLLLADQVLVDHQLSLLIALNLRVGTLLLTLSLVLLHTPKWIAQKKVVLLELGLQHRHLLQVFHGVVEDAHGVGHLWLILLELISLIHASMVRALPLMKYLFILLNVQMVMSLNLLSQSESEALILLLLSIYFIFINDLIIVSLITKTSNAVIVEVNLILISLSCATGISWLNLVFFLLIGFCSNCSRSRNKESNWLLTLYHIQEVSIAIETIGLGIYLLLGIILEIVSILTSIVKHILNWIVLTPWQWCCTHQTVLNCRILSNLLIVLFN
jgi:hypothetical protein